MEDQAQQDPEQLIELERAVVPLMDEVATPKFLKFEDLRNWLIDHVAHLLERNFEQMLRILYLIDVDEQKVKRLIQEDEGESPETVIADLILERQAEKIRSRKKYKPRDGKYFHD